MTASYDVNINQSECLRTVVDIGVNHIHNVCTGAVTDLSWGIVDWANALGLTLIFGPIVIGIIVALIRGNSP